MFRSFKVRAYKCFIKDEDFQGFDTIKPINIIIGKNNSGKSKILEALKEFIKSIETKERIENETSFEIQLSKTSSQEDIDNIFRHLGYRDGQRRDFYVQNGIKNAKINATLESKNGQKNITVFNNLDGLTSHGHSLEHIGIHNDINYKCLHLQAERNLEPEPIYFEKDIKDSNIHNNAVGITSLIARMINDEDGHSKHWQEYIEKDFLNKINSIIEPDIKFTRIYTKTNQNHLYELYFTEDKKGGIKLSDCGSGLKTIIATLALLHIIPFIQGEEKTIFIFEELENNMHPHLERKLLTHIRNYAEEHKNCFFFLSTHSNVAIDMFGNYEFAQIVKASNDGNKSILEKVDSWKEKKILLDDLGVKASDLLQSNCTIWVEGPSDRIYINKLIELFNSGSSLEEGLHYQCVFYGGSLLAHYSCGDSELIDLLKINKNSYVIMDSDIKAKEGELKERVKNIISSMPEQNYWVTQGKEIENYIPDNILQNYFNDENFTLGQYGLMPDLYKSKKGVENFDKVSFASQIINDSLYSKKTLENHLDLKEQVEKIINFIRISNQLI